MFAKQWCIIFGALCASSQPPKDVSRPLTAQAMIKDIKQFGEDFERFINRLEEQKLDLKFIDNLLDKFTAAHNKLSKIHWDKEKTFLLRIKGAIYEMGVNISSETLGRFDNSVPSNSLSKDLTKLKSQDISQIKDVINNVIKLLKDSQRWYRFLHDLTASLSTYRIQKSITKFKSITSQLIQQLKTAEAAESGKNNVSNNLVEFLNKIGADSAIVKKINDVKMGKFKVKALMNAIESITDNIKFDCAKSGRLEAVAVSVRISDVLNHNCPKPIISYNIVAHNKMFIDNYVTKVGKPVKVAIVARKTEILNNVLPGGQNSTKSIMEFIVDKEGNFNLLPNSKSVFLLGESGLGKNILAKIMSQKTEMGDINPYPFEYEFEDKQKMTTWTIWTSYLENQDILSKAVVPRVFFETKAPNTIYVDLPSFYYVENVNNDIITTYFLKKILQFTGQVKIVFIVEHSMVRNWAVSRAPFLRAMRSVIDRTKNIDKLEKSIGMIVTNVDNQFFEAHYTFYIPNDEAIMKEMGAFMEETRTRLIKELKYNISLDRPFDETAVKLLNIFLLKEKGNYVNIKILHRITDTKTPLMIQAKVRDQVNAIKSMITLQLKFVPVATVDFQFNSLTEFQKRVNGMATEIQTDMNNAVNKIWENINRTFKEKEKELNFDVSMMVNTFTSAYDKISKIDSEKPRVFLRHICCELKAIKVSIAEKNIQSAYDDIEYLNILTRISEKQSIQSNAASLKKHLNESVNYLEDSRLWYQFLKELFDDSTKYETQKIVKDLNNIAKKVMVQCDTNKTEINVNDIALEELLMKLNSSIYPQVKGMNVNVIKLQALKAIIQFTIVDQAAVTCAGPHRLAAYGNYIKLSQVIEHWCNEIIKFYEIFAVDKVFIDVDVKKIGEQVLFTIVAPKWEIIGKHQITLDGIDGSPARATKSKMKPGDAGAEGAPGVPGTPAGHFVGIGSIFVNSESLTISANGGKGSNGLDGGDGSSVKGQDPPILSVEKRQKPSILPEKQYELLGFEVISHNKYNAFLPVIGVGSISSSTSIIDNIVSKSSSTKVTNTIEVIGKEAIAADGGNGGAGGEGGKAGDITIIALHEEPKFTILSKDGASGSDGRGGKGSPRMKNGDIVKISYEIARVRTGKSTIKRNSVESRGYKAAGKKGIDGFNRNEMKQFPIVIAPDGIELMDNYKKFVNSFSNRNILKNQTLEFFKDYVKYALGMLNLTST